MAVPIVARTPSAPSCATDAPDLDAVVVWLTLTIERDYIERGVFPAYRTHTAATSRANATLHYLTREQAEALLADAEARCLDTYKSMKVAFKAHAEKLRSALDEAIERRARFEAPEPVCIYRSQWSESWRGTKEQLTSIGVALEGPYPGEQGGKNRWAQTHDQRGYKVRITRASTTWAGLFLAYIEVPEDVREKLQETKKQADAERARLERLKTMPATPDKYRDDVADCFWTWVSITKRQMESSDGYRFTSDVVDEFIETVSEAYWTIKNGETTGCSPRKKLQLVLGESAKADKPLQRFLANLSSGASE